MPADGAVRTTSSEVASLMKSCGLAEIVSPDMLGNWRLRKSSSLVSARWSLKNGRKSEASQYVLGARACHGEVMRIQQHQRSRGRQFTFASGRVG